MKKLFFLVSLLAMSASMNAQLSEVKEIKSFEVAPKLFRYGGQSFMLTETGDSDVRTIDVYNDDIEKVRSFQIELPARTQDYKYFQRKQEAKETSRDSTQVTGDYDYNIRDYKKVFTWVEALELATDRGFSRQQSGYYIYPDNEYDYYNSYTFGTLYPYSYYRWIPETGFLYQYNISYKTTYTGEWEETSSSTNLSSSYVLHDLYFCNFDGDSAYPDAEFGFTQTLFNTDEKFEYLLPIYGEMQERVSYEYDSDNDGEVDHRSIEYYTPQKGMKVVSEDGTVLQTVEWEYEGSRYHYDYGIYKINNKIYLAIERDNDQGDYFSTIYRIDPTSSSIRKVNDVPASVVARYSIDGRRQSHPRRGVNILRYSDGTAVKVMEK